VYQETKVTYSTIIQHSNPKSVEVDCPLIEYVNAYC